MKALIEVLGNELLVSHRVIAEHTANKVVSIQNLITSNIDDLKEFGKLHFKNEAIKNSKNKTNKQVTYYLNEYQFYLLITYIRNNDKVREFKKALIKEFHSLKNSKGLQGRVEGLTKANYSYKKYINKLLNDIKLLENKQKQIPNKCVLDFKVWGRNDLLEFVASVQRQEQDLNDCFKIMIHNYKITNKMMNNFLKLYPEVNPDSKSRTFTDY